MDLATKQRFFEFLSTYVSEHKLNRYNEVLSYRTRHMTVVLEDIYQSQNASAVLRSAECFGVQDIHIVENYNRYELNPDVAMGSPKWLTMHKYKKSENSTALCFNALREKGYRIVATSPHAKGYTMYNFPIEEKFALVFGTELKGLSPYAMEQADEYVAIPLFGFTESFNISVTAALFLHEFKTRMHQSAINWHLTDEEKLDLSIEWAKKSIKRVDLLEKYFNDCLLQG